MTLIIIGSHIVALLVAAVIRGRRKRRATWLSVQARLHSGNVSMPESETSDLVQARGVIDGSHFYDQCYSANNAGIRIEWPRAPDEPIVLAWSRVKELEDFPVAPGNYKSAERGVRIDLEPGDRQVELIPWPREFGSYVPSTVQYYFVKVMADPIR